MMNDFRHITRLMLLLLLFLAACGGGEEQPAAQPPATEAPQVEVAEVATNTSLPPTEAPVPTEAPAIASFRDALKGTIQIEAQGSFMDPEFGMMLNAAGRGSGFIIHESGIAVTNNHVVTGAAFLKVWVGGENGDPLNAKVLGVSECSDLAVIDIEGDGFTPLTWFDGQPAIGTEIYALGFPLGDPEPTITRGIISKEEADGETGWASVDAVLEHDATINPGNSGGPLVNSAGEVVGVNYAGSSSTSQFYAINSAKASDIVEQLRSGIDVDSIGINGEAVDDGQGNTGIWVASVKSGSPADKAGIKAGDIVTRLEGLVLATDGTMADYCDILRSRNATDTMSVEVLRYATAELLEGQLNGRVLEQTFSFAQAIEEEVPVQEPAPEPGDDQPAAAEYVGIYDDNGAVFVEVPASWTDIDGATWIDEEDGTVLGSSLLATPSIDGFNTTYGTPGIQILASDGFAGMAMDELVDLFDFSDDCIYDGRYDYEDPIFTGRYDLYVDCGSDQSVVVVVSTQPADASYAVILLAQALTEADLDAIDHVLNTFNVVGDLPGN